MASPSRQRGSLLIYSWLGAAAVMLLLGIALKVQSARLDAAQQKVEALEQQVAQWRGAAKTCSDATLKASEEAQKRATAAQVALKQAQAGGIASKAEAARLRGLVGKKPVSACPAGEAVEKVREGLK